MTVEARRKLQQLSIQRHEFKGFHSTQLFSISLQENGVWIAGLDLDYYLAPISFIFICLHLLFCK